MTQPRVTAIAAAIVEAANSFGLRARGYEPDGQWQPIELLVPSPDIEQITFTDDGVFRLTYDLILVVGSADDRSAHIELGDHMETARQSLQADKTFGSVVQGSFLRSVSANDEIRDRQDAVWFGAILQLEVHT